MPWYGECWIYYEFPGIFPIVVTVERLVRNGTQDRYEPYGEQRLDNFLNIVPLDAESDEQRTRVLERVTLVALLIALTSLVMQLFSAHREETRSLESKMDSLINSRDDDLEDELVEELTKQLMVERKTAPPRPPSSP